MPIENKINTGTKTVDVFKTIYKCKYCGFESENDYEALSCERSHEREQIKKDCEKTSHKLTKFSMEGDAGYDTRSWGFTIYASCNCGKIKDEAYIDLDPIEDEKHHLKKLSEILYYTVSDYCTKNNI